MEDSYVEKRFPRFFEVLGKVDRMIDEHAGEVIVVDVSGPKDLDDCVAAFQFVTRVPARVDASKYIYDEPGEYAVGIDRCGGDDCDALVVAYRIV